jgi:hypothetical protein
MSTRNYVGGVLREFWNDTTRTYTAYNASGAVTSTRPYTTLENQNADREAADTSRLNSKSALLSQLYSGVAQIQSARDAANADIAAADSLNTQALTLSSQTQARITAVAGWTPSATYSQADINLIKSEISSILTRQKQILDAMADMYVYRKAVDQNALSTDDALLWLARLVSDNIA